MTLLTLHDLMCVFFLCSCFFLYLLTDYLNTVVRSESEVTMIEERIQMKYQVQASQGFVYAAHRTHERKATKTVISRSVKVVDSGSDGEPPVKSSKRGLDDMSPTKNRKESDKGKSDETPQDAPMETTTDDVKEPSEDADTTLTDATAEVSKEMPMEISMGDQMEDHKDTSKDHLDDEESAKQVKDSTKDDDVPSEKAHSKTPSEVSIEFRAETPIEAVEQAPTEALIELPPVHPSSKALTEQPAEVVTDINQDSDKTVVAKGKRGPPPPTPPKPKRKVIEPVETVDDSDSDAEPMEEQDFAASKDMLRPLHSTPADDDIDDKNQKTQEKEEQDSAELIPSPETHKLTISVKSIAKSADKDQDDPSSGKEFEDAEKPAETSHDDQSLAHFKDDSHEPTETILQDESEEREYDFEDFEDELQLLKPEDDVTEENDLEDTPGIPAESEGHHRTSPDGVEEDDETAEDTIPMALLKLNPLYVVEKEDEIAEDIPVDGRATEADATYSKENEEDGLEKIGVGKDEDEDSDHSISEVDLLEITEDLGLVIDESEPELQELKSSSSDGSDFDDKLSEPHVEEPMLQQRRVRPTQLAPLTIDDETFISVSPMSADDRRPKMYAGTPTKVPASLLLDTLNIEPLSDERIRSLQDEEETRRPKMFSPDQGVERSQPFIFDDAPKPVQEPTLLQETIAPTELSPMFSELEDPKSGMLEDDDEDDELKDEQTVIEIDTTLEMTPSLSISESDNKSDMLVDDKDGDKDEDEDDEGEGDSSSEESEDEKTVIEIDTTLEVTPALSISESGDERDSNPDGEEDAEEQVPLPGNKGSDDKDIATDDKEPDQDEAEQRKLDTSCSSDKEPDDDHIPASDEDEDGETASGPSAPSFTVEIKDMYCLDGESVDFLVCFEGHPPPEVSWFRDDERLRNNEDFQIVTDDTSSRLHIPDVFVEDSGDFMVEITNEHGSERCMSYLEVEGIFTLCIIDLYGGGAILHTHDSCQSIYRTHKYCIQY